MAKRIKEEDRQRRQKGEAVRSLKAEKKSSFYSRILIIIGVLILLALIYFLIPQGSDKWNVSDQGILSYPENRGKVDVKVLKTESNPNYTLETISFPSKDYTVEGLLRIPSSGKKVAAVVILPGATVPMEGTQTLADIFSSMGYASLGIEQRNRGGVDFRSDFDLWKNGKEPVEHKMVFDALRAVDVLRQNPSIDPDKIAIVGESNGGRFAIIAAAIDPKISGVIGISTSGYDTESQVSQIKDENVIRFYRSIDPETYLKFIPPRKFVMIHSDNDNIIQIQFARNTFEKALEPKQFYNVTTGTHGYSEGMKEPLMNELKSMFG
ncbi:MAG: acetylxylan esterase [Candidatus Methanoperedens sp.]|nr:acetylxylan esterase [Candidatus Methanoperedens sp.]